MVQTKIIGRKLKTKYRGCVILPIGSAIKLKHFNTQQNSKEADTLEEGLLRYWVQKEQPNWTIVQTIVVALQFVVLVLVWVRRICSYILSFPPFSLVHVFHFLHNYIVI